VQVEAFTDAPEVLAVVRDVQARKTHDSDIIDDEGHQYVDLVLEGGGMLGLALSGYAHVLEQAGLRFAGIGGTSAGSVTALLLAASGPPAAARVPAIVRLLATTDTRAWIDGSPDARALVQAFAEGAGAARMVWRVSQALDEFVDLGLHPGDAVYRWLSTELARVGIISTADLERRMTTCPAGLRTRDGQDLRASAAALFRLAVIAVDLRTETRLELPRMASLLWSRPEEVDPAWFVRASMSVPLFYSPVRIKDVPQGEAARRRWEALTGYTGQVPDECVLVDGGLISNFPIDVFHRRQKLPQHPTFGVKLAPFRGANPPIGGVHELLGACFRAAAHARDDDVILHNPDFKQLVAVIDTSGFNWLDFDMSPEQKLALFTRGAVAAGDFLRSFDWPRYKEVRAHLIKAARAAW
jgi:NTE family protein